MGDRDGVLVCVGGSVGVDVGYRVVVGCMVKVGTEVGTGVLGASVGDVDGDDVGVLVVVGCIVVGSIGAAVVGTATDIEGTAVTAFATGGGVAASTDGVGAAVDSGSVTSSAYVVDWYRADAAAANNIVLARLCFGRILFPDTLDIGDTVDW